MNVEPNSGETQRTPKNVLFIHILKTAGMAFGNVFCFAFERYLPSQPAHDLAWREALKDDSSFFISGHFQYRQVKDVVSRNDVFAITLLRNPFDQLISHLRWVKAYGNPKRADKLGEIGPNIAKIAIELWQTHLGDVER